ncbi:MAG: response regulator [Catenulispora sp.]
MTRDTIRVLIADDHTVLRQLVQEYLDSREDVTVVGQAGNGDEVLELAVRLRPDVVLLDIEMPGTAAPVVVYRLARVCPETAVVILSMHDGPEHTGEMLQLGVRGFLHKSSSMRQVLSAIRDAAEPHATVTLSVRHGGRSPDSAESVLSRREREVLALVAKAMSNRQIALRLDITEATVKRHLRNAYGKLGANSRLDAVNKAVAASLIRGTAHERAPVRPAPTRPVAANAQITRGLTSGPGRLAGQGRVGEPLPRLRQEANA